MIHSLGYESILKFIYVLHQLLVHLNLLHCNLPSTGKVLSHVVILFVLNGPLKGGDHLSLSLNELDLFLDGVKVSIVDVLLCTHPLFLHQLAVHHVLDVRVFEHFFVLLVRMSWHLRAH